MGEGRSDSVGIFVAENWVDSVVSVERQSKRVLILKMVLDNGLLNVLMLLTQETGGGKRDDFVGVKFYCLQRRHLAHSN